MLSSIPLTKIRVSATALMIARITISQIGGNSSFFPIFFQSIALPLELDRKGAALTVNTLHTDLTAENIHYPLYKGQPKAVALGGVGGVALIEFFKNVISNILRNSATGIFYFYNNYKFFSDFFHFSPEISHSFYIRMLYYRL